MEGTTLLHRFRTKCRRHHPGASTATTRSGAHTPVVVEVSAFDARTHDAFCCAAQRAATDVHVVIDDAALVVGVVQVKSHARSAALATAPKSTRKFHLKHFKI